MGILRGAVDRKTLIVGASLFVVGLVFLPVARWLTAGDREPAAASSTGEISLEGPTYGGADDCLGCELRSSNPYLHYSPSGQCSAQDPKVWRLDLQ